MNIESLLQTAKTGFESLKVGEIHKQNALHQLEYWLTDAALTEYTAQIEHMINAGHFDYLLDCFYQIIPFGTGGRRGEVGIGPNRINRWTIQSSAQGHSQYLIRQYGDEAKIRGVVLAYDIRQFFTNKYFNESIANPVTNLTCKDLAISAAEVYTANGIKVFIFDSFRTTPELSFAIRHLKCVGGDMFSASHNPPEHNGKKVYDEFGGQLIPPQDEALVVEVTQKVTEIKKKDFKLAESEGLLETISEVVDESYITTCMKNSLSEARDIKIVYTPLHGCGSTSVLKVLDRLGFTVNPDPKTIYPSGKFENVTFNIPNPEVEQSFDTPKKYADEIGADIILSSDPDADRIGIMVRHDNSWHFLNGNEIAAVLTKYVIDKKIGKITGEGVIIKTEVTTNILREICQKNNVRLIGDLLVGYKYVGQTMNQLEAEGKIDSVLFSCEESHGYLSGNYVRDKDAVIPAIWLSELSAELKSKGLTLIDYLNEIYAEYGYFRNYLTVIRLPGAEGMTKIQTIMNFLRATPPKLFGDFVVQKIEDWQARLPIVSETDRVSKNGIVFHLKPIIGTVSIKVTVRPSGTLPESKIYFEIGTLPFDVSNFEQTRLDTEGILNTLESSFMKSIYKIIGIDFPDRGFLLFWQLPLQDKLKYFEIESQIETIANLPLEQRQKSISSLLSFLGSDPIQKVDKAFQAKYHKTVLEYLELNGN